LSLSRRSVSIALGVPLMEVVTSLVSIETLPSYGGELTLSSLGASAGCRVGSGPFT
jgi:hypothetical protein